MRYWIFIIICYLSFGLLGEGQVNCETLVRNFAFNNDWALEDPIKIISQYQLNHENLTNQLFTIISDIENQKTSHFFSEDYEFEKDRILLIAFHWLSEIAHTREVALMIKEKFYHYNPNDVWRRDFAQCMLISLDGEELSDFICEYIKEDYPYHYIVSLLKFCKTISQKDPIKTETINSSIVWSLNQMKDFEKFIRFDKSVSVIFPNYTYSDCRKEVLNRAITYFTNHPEREKDRLELEERLKLIYKKERAEWWCKHRWHIFLGSGFLIITIFAIIRAMRLSVHRHPS